MKKSSKFVQFFQNIAVAIQSYYKKAIFKIVSPIVNEEIAKKLSDFKLTAQGYKEGFDTLSDTVNSIELKLTPQRVAQILDPNRYEIASKGLVIRITKDPSSKDRLAFHASKPCWDNEPTTGWFVNVPYSAKIYSHQQNGIEYWTPGNSLDKFLSKLFATGHVAQLSPDNAMNFNITKSGASTWDEVLGPIIDAIASIFPDVKVEQEKTLETETENILA